MKFNVNLMFFSVKYSAYRERNRSSYVNIQLHLFNILIRRLLYFVSMWIVVLIITIKRNLFLQYLKF